MNESLWQRIYSWYHDSWIYTYYKYSWLYNLRWKITHWWHKVHWVHCDLPCTYHDKVELMESALFTLVEDFIARDQEDGAAIVVIEPDDMEKIVQILHFYRIEKPELEKKYVTLLDLLYGKMDMVFHDCDREGCKELEMVDKSGLTKEERERKTKELQELEQEIEDKTQFYLHMCVDIRNVLWS